MYETFEHTADLGLRARAADLDALFVEMARALMSVLVENPEAIRPVERLSFRIDGTDRELLLLDWLQELLFRFEESQMLFGRFELFLTPAGLEAHAWGERLDRERHLASHEVKAITYHGLKVESEDGGWLAEVIVDI